MSRTMALNNMLSPSEIVRRIERARLPTSKSSYNQSSAFQMEISLCLAGSGFGFFTGPLSLLGDSASRSSPRGIMLVQPSDQVGVVHCSAQAAIDLDSCGFEETNKSVEARPQIGGLQGLQRAGKKAVGHSVNRRVSPCGQASRLASCAKISATLMFRAHQPFGVGDGFRWMRTELADCGSRSPQHRAGTSARADPRSIRELQSHWIADSRVIGVTKTVRTVDCVGFADHEIVNLDRIPLHTAGMGQFDERVQSIQYLGTDRVVHEMVTFLGNGVSETSAQGEEKTDCIRRTRWYHDVFCRFARSLSHLQNIVESVGDSGRQCS